ncbi:MAG: hypothetical protein JWQ14_417 [Adhaeribacter sp.]|jgi:hypothetical protein|nr:hypothetical protein [Adhaeribacter sp.]
MVRIMCQLPVNGFHYRMALVSDVDYLLQVFWRE